LFEEQLESL